MRRIFLTIIAVCTLGSCDNSTVEPEIPDFDYSDKNYLAFEHVRGSYGGDSPMAYVFRNVDDWNFFYETYRSLILEEYRIPEIPADFDREMLIGVFYGEIGGCEMYLDTIDNIRIENGQIIVKVIAMPEINGICDTIIMFYDLAKLERRDEPVIFIGEVPGK